MIDSGMLNNFPIDLFDNVSHLPNGEVVRSANPYTLGFRIDQQEQIQSDSMNHVLIAQPVSAFKVFLIANYILLSECNNRSKL
jgi:hypothetical protein